jgi:antitoxin component YwqK of YwqJK toxin-antitoxin module
MKNLIVAFFLFFAIGTTAQTMNQLDEKGERHGSWKANFDKTNEPRYEGTFEHGKEVGTFKFYKLVDGKSKLSATREFIPGSDKINVKFFSSKGKIISEGMMKDKLFIGKWTYYQNKSNGILTIENYNDKGILEGERMVYYENGQVAEKSIYVNGEIDGTSMWYSPNGKALKEFTYKNGELHGMAKYYDKDGVILAEGIYRNDKKHGIWKYYENGKLTEEKDFTTYSKNPIKQ